MPVPLAEFPKLKYRAWAENREESGSNRTAKGSSNDSSISLGVKEPLSSKGGLYQSNSIQAGQLYIKRPCNVTTMYLHNDRSFVKIFRWCVSLLANLRIRLFSVNMANNGWHQHVTCGCLRGLPKHNSSRSKKPAIIFRDPNVQAHVECQSALFTQVVP